jgi:hypothetical protein
LQRCLSRDMEVIRVALAESWRPGFASCFANKPPAFST